MADSRVWLRKAWGEQLTELKKAGRGGAHPISPTLWKVKAGGSQVQAPPGGSEIENKKGLGRLSVEALNSIPSTATYKQIKPKKDYDERTEDSYFKKTANGN